MAMFAIGFRGTFLGKDTLFRWPASAVLRWLGGIPVDRASPHNVVQQTIDYFHARPQMVLALSPEGTRRKLPAWRTGFWYVAKGAGVPIVPVAFDFPARRDQDLRAGDAGRRHRRRHRPAARALRREHGQAPRPVLSRWRRRKVPFRPAGGTM